MIAALITLLIIELILIVSSVECEEGWLAFLFFVAGIIALHFWLYKGIVTIWWVFISANPLLAVLICFGWLAFGIFWSFFKWYMYLKKMRNERINYKVDLEHHEIKYMIMRWIWWWPFSMTWFLIHDPINRVSRWMYKNVNGVYIKIYNSVFDIKQ